MSPEAPLLQNHFHSFHYLLPSHYCVHGLCFLRSWVPLIPHVMVVISTRREIQAWNP